MNNEKINSKIKISNNSSCVILIFVILKFQNIGFLHSVVPNFDPHPNIFEIFFQYYGAMWDIYLIGINDIFEQLLSC